VEVRGIYITLTCEYGVAGGHLEALHWVRDHHCPWDEGSAKLFPAISNEFD
jgi:hypothetical protein